MTRHIGIDCGIHTGIALWDSKHKALHLCTLSFWQAIDYIREQKSICDRDGIVLKAVLEDVTQNKPVFPKKGVANNSALLRVAQNIGSNKRDSQLMAEFLKLHGIETRLVKPTTAKWKAEEFMKITRYEGSSSQHARDAAKLVYGL